MAVSYSNDAETLRTDRYRLIRHGGKKARPSFELYDHQDPAGETKNIADAHPDLVEELNAKLDAKMKPQAGGD